VGPSCKEKPCGSGLKRIALAAAVVALQFILTGPAMAGFPDKDQLATGKPENKLSGIKVGIRPPSTRFPNGTAISKIIQTYGPPTSKEDAVVPDGAGGTRFYVWQWPGLRMSIATYFYYCPQVDNLGADSLNACSKSAGQTMVESRPAYIDVWGDAPRGVLGRTGRGLQLGSTLKQQKAIYGDRYTVQYAEKGTTASLLAQWPDGTELTLDYGPSERINHIRLSCRER
jgi:hypothetical protein